MPVLYKDYNISKDPERHGIGGASSGAIAAFTVALERPNEFQKMLSMIGSFTNLRGGHQYADMVRRSEKKPLRVYLQDGRNDNRGVGREGKYDESRDWFVQNVRLVRALSDGGYDLNSADVRSRTTGGLPNLHQTRGKVAGRGIPCIQSLTACKPSRPLISGLTEATLRLTACQSTQKFFE